MAIKFDTPGAEWQTISPEAAGWDPKLLADAISYAQEINYDRLFIASRGRVVATNGDVTALTDIRSCRKLIYAVLFGVMLGEGVISLDTTLDDLDVSDGANGNQPTLSAQERTATMRDLLESRSGVYHPAAFETSAMETNRPDRDQYLPGEIYFYNNWDFNIVPCLLAVLDGRGIEGVFDLLEEKLFSPLGFQDWDKGRQRYTYSSAKSIYPASRLFLSSRDCARVLALLCNDGVWGGQRLLPEGWVDLMGTTHLDLSSNTGRGYFCDTRVSTAGVVADYDRVTATIRHSGTTRQALIAYRSLNLSIPTLRSTEGDTPSGGQRNNLLERIRNAQMGIRLSEEPIDPPDDDEDEG